jgi:hypothetical protein
MLFGAMAYLRTDREFEDAFEMLVRSDDALAHVANTAMEQTAGRYFVICSLHKIGNFSKLRGYSERYLREAEQRGNNYARTTFRRLSSILSLADDDPDRAREELRTDSWVSHAQGYHLQHWLELIARVDLAIYEGSPVDQEFFVQHMKGYKKSSLQRFLDYRCGTAWMMGRMALAGAPRQASWRRTVRWAIGNLRSCKTHYSRMLAHMLRATLAVQDGERERAVGELREVVALGEAARILYITAAARRRLGVLVGGDEGRALVTAADHAMIEAGIKNVERMTYLVSPCDPSAR